MKKHWIYSPDVQAILNEVQVESAEDGLAEFAGLDASGAKALLGLLEHLGPNSLERRHNFSPTQRELLQACIRYDGLLSGFIFTRSGDEGLSIDEILIPSQGWSTASALSWMIDSDEVCEIEIEGKKYLRFWWD